MIGAVYALDLKAGRVNELDTCSPQHSSSMIQGPLNFYLAMGTLSRWRIERLTCKNVTVRLQ